METKFNFSKICQGLLKNLPPRNREVIQRRFGLTPAAGSAQREKETLDSIGKSWGITRERVRQIEQDGFSRLGRTDHPCQDVFTHLRKELLKTSGFREEKSFLNCLAPCLPQRRPCLPQCRPSNFRNHVLFLLTLGREFQRFGENKELCAFWTIDAQMVNQLQECLAFLGEKFKEKKQPLSLEEVDFLISSNFPHFEGKQTAAALLEISKVIKRGPEGLFGLRDWEEINPRGVKDWAYFALKKEQRPLHFVKTAELVGRLCPKGSPVLCQTVHNELIKDERFVLVGRGLYALKEWGYESGPVKEVITRVLERTSRPLSTEEIVEEVLKQRFVKKNTILINLNDKERFFKNDEGKYVLRQV